jgi:hypothetical protein
MWWIVAASSWGSRVGPFIRLEMTLRMEVPGVLDKMESVAADRLTEWNARKQRKYGAAT